MRSEINVTFLFVCIFVFGIAHVYCTHHTNVVFMKSTLETWSNKEIPRSKEIEE